LQRFMLRPDSTTILNSHHIISTLANSSEPKKLYMCRMVEPEVLGVMPSCQGITQQNEWGPPVWCALVLVQQEIMECDFPPDEQEGIPCWPTWCGYILQNVMLPMSSFQSMKALWVHCLFGILIVPDNSEG
jgi:hypothetical protein